ncbi:DUF2267 domain-containing protein [Haloplanus sp. C73]|uniref:DUF2267 domain-containing protein n=1 Tax=Haloplanus sp. C73 TaxID=3421641 RepID=UPI003EBF8343
MNYEDFLGEIQHRLELSSQGEAARATRAVLTTLGERLDAGEASDLAAPLPMEIDRYLTAAESGQQFSYDEFVDRVADRANVEESEAAFYAQAVVSLVSELATGGEMADVQAQLPDEFGDLFELAEAQSVPW